MDSKAPTTKEISLKMHIDTDVWTGHGVCEDIRPDIFEVGDDPPLARRRL
ncbi:MAG: hypothetical protein USCGTAYLOR_01928 [Chromatiales bacterium USCg_Taylor]|nr:MAG: hypothetical protein USCGTAYLOR_01928 [Chromatiales bacterium USCg_Taylor]